jgi:hypothetical protein
MNLNEKKTKLYLTSPTTGQVDIHYMRSVFLLQAECNKRKIGITLHLHKSSIVTFGRNACTAAFLHSDASHMLFVDTDIQFNEKDIFKMLEADKEISLIPYPMKWYDWKKAEEMYKSYKVPMNKGGYHFPMKILNPDDFISEEGFIEIEKGPAGCMLIKREAIERMIKHYPDLKVKQKHLINEQTKDSTYSYNFWDTEFNKETGSIVGEDFAFCDRFRKAGGQIFAFVESEIAHHGNYPFKARFIDECAKIE